MSKIEEKKDVYKPIKISGAFSDNYAECKSDSKKDKSVSIKNYLDKIREHLRKMINDKKKSGEWKIQLIMKINSISSKNYNDVRDMYSKSDNVEIMMSTDNIEIIEKLFDSILKRCQEGLEVSMRGSDFVFDYVESLNYIFHKIDLKRGGSFIETPKRIKKKKATINVEKYDDNNCFQYSVAVELNYDEIGKSHQRVNNGKPFVEKYDWNGVNFPPEIPDWKRSESNNKSIALNVLYVPYGEKNIRHANKSKYNSKREKQIILLMISDAGKYHYLTVRRLSALLKGVTSNHNGDFYCLNCFHSYRTKRLLKMHNNVCENNDFCYVEMPEGDAKVKYHHGVKSMRAPFVMYADLESLLKKMDTCINDPEKSSTTKINKHEICGYSLITHCSFDEKRMRLIIIEAKIL